LQLLIIENKDY